jgi:hypothetical protein
MVAIFESSLGEIGKSFTNDTVKRFFGKHSLRHLSDNLATMTVEEINEHLSTVGLKGPLAIEVALSKDILANISDPTSTDQRTQILRSADNYPSARIIRTSVQTEGRDWADFNTGRIQTKVIAWHAKNKAGGFMRKHTQAMSKDAMLNLLTETLDDLIKYMPKPIKKVSASVYQTTYATCIAQGMSEAYATQSAENAISGSLFLRFLNIEIPIAAGQMNAKKEGQEISSFHSVNQLLLNSVTGAKKNMAYHGVAKEDLGKPVATWNKFLKGLKKPSL